MSDKQYRDFLYYDSSWWQHKTALFKNLRDKVIQDSNEHWVIKQWT